MHCNTIEGDLEARYIGYTSHILAFDGPIPVPVLYYNIRIQYCQVGVSIIRENSFHEDIVKNFLGLCEIGDIYLNLK